MNCWIIRGPGNELDEQCVYVCCVFADDAVGARGGVRKDVRGNY